MDRAGEKTLPSWEWPLHVLCGPVATSVIFGRSLEMLKKKGEERREITSRQHRGFRVCSGSPLLILVLFAR